MQEKNSSKKLANEIRLAISAPKYKVTDFWCACPFEPNDLIKENRKREVMLWRHLGVVWHVLSGMGPFRAGKVFERNHATVLHSLKEVAKALDMPSQHKELHTIIQAVKDMSKRTDANVRDSEVASSLLLERALHNMRPWHLNPKEFYCQTFIIDQRMGDTPKRCAKQCSACQ